MNIPDQIHAYLRAHPEGASSEELAGRFLRAVASPQICRAALISVLRDDARCALSPDGRWRTVPEQDPLERSLNRATFAVLEVTCSLPEDRMAEISARRVRGGKVGAQFDASTDSDARVEDRVPELSDILGEDLVVMYGSSAKIRMVNRALLRRGEEEIENALLFLDRVLRRLRPETKVGSLEEMAATLTIPCGETDRAAPNADVLVEILHHLIEEAWARGIGSVRELLEYQDPEITPIDFTRYAFDQDDLRTFPEAPGVYVMRDRTGHVIYVGKSKDLRSRVRSYFATASGRTEKTGRILKAVYDISCETVGSELEALLLEHRRIRMYDPEINRQMEVHERSDGGRRCGNRMVLLPSCAEGYVELFLVSKGRPVRQIRCRRDDDDLADLRRAIQKTYFSPDAEDTAGGDTGRAETEIVYRWLDRRLDQINSVDLDAVADSEDAIRLLRQYLKAPDEKVYYR